MYEFAFITGTVVLADQLTWGVMVVAPFVLIMPLNFIHQPTVDVAVTTVVATVSTHVITGAAGAPSAALITEMTL